MCTCPCDGVYMGLYTLMRACVSVCFREIICELKKTKNITWYLFTTLVIALYTLLNSCAISHTKPAPINKLNANYQYG